MRCPECSTPIEIGQVRYPVFKCSSCGCDLCIPTDFQVRNLALGAIAAFLGAFILRFNGITFVVIGTLSSFVIAALVEIFVLLVAPPTLNRYIRPGSLGLR